MSTEQFIGRQKNVNITFFSDDKEVAVKVTIRAMTAPQVAQILKYLKPLLPYIEGAETIFYTVFLETFAENFDDIFQRLSDCFTFHNYEASTICNIGAEVVMDLFDTFYEVNGPFFMRLKELTPTGLLKPENKGGEDEKSKNS